MPRRCQACATRHVNDITSNIYADYWTTIIFKQLVGTRVLSVADSTNYGRSTRIYAFCSRNITGGVVVVGINLNTTPTSFTFDAFSVSPRIEYQLTAPSGNMSSPSIELNGVVLHASPSGDLPPLSGAEVTDGSPVTLQGTSYGMFVFPEASAPACYF